MAEFSTHSNNTDDGAAQRECERLAALLTAFFDGETEAEETRRARQHLLECARCALALEAWQRTRYLLQASPVPTVPVGLLVRILLACRLSALPRRKQTSFATHSQPVSFQAHDMEMLSAQRDEANLGFELAPVRLPAPDVFDSQRPMTDAPLSAFMLPVPVPPHLKDAILKRTVGLTEEKNAPTQAVSLPLTATPSSSRKLRWDFGRAMPRRAGQFAAFAVPASLAWLLLVTPRVPTIELATSLPPSPATVPHKTPVTALGRLAKLPVAPVSAAPASRPAAAKVQPNAAPVAAPVAPAVTALDATNEPATSEATQPNAHAMLASYERAPQPALAPSTRSADATTTAAIKPTATHPQPQIAAPRLTLTSMPLKWSRSNEASAGGNVGSGSRNLHVAVLDLDSQARQPQPNDGDDSSDTADDISDISDHRPAEARQAIDSYRAALLSDAPASDSATPANDTDDSGADG